MEGISRRRTKAALARCLMMLVVGAPTLLAQTGSGSISGKVLTEDGSPVANVQVTASLALPGTTTAPASPLGPRATVLGPRAARADTAQDGSFQLSGLPAGSVVLCAATRTFGLLDPCHWAAQPPTITLAAGQSVTGFKLTLAAGSLLQVRLDDQGKLLKKQAQGHLPLVMFSVVTPQRVPFTVPLVNEDDKGRNYQMAVPYDTAMTLAVISPDLELADDRGASLDSKGNQVAFIHSRKKVPSKPLVFHVVKAKH